MAKQRPLWPRRARRIVQAAAFVLFLAFVAAMPSLLAHRRGGGFGLMRLSPYAGAGAMACAWGLIAAFWPAAVLLAGALLLGRFFCGWLCPLGATIDLSERITGVRRGPQPKGDAEFEHVRARRLKYYLLTAAFAGAFVGLSFYGLFDPLSIAVRSFTVAVHAYLWRGLSALFGALGWGGARAVARSALGVGAEPIFRLQVVTLLALLGILALGLVRRRFWCRYVCPLGAVYALAAKPAVTKRSVSDACIECGRCVGACPMSCISPDGRRTLTGECILCLQCQPVCPTDAIRFFRRAPAEQRREVDLTRRGVMAGAAVGLLAHPVLRTTYSWAQAKVDPLIRPPLAGRDVDEFLSKCLRCGQCMRACPTQVIHPAGLGAGIESLWTPRLAPRPGYCEYNCVRCGQACPSGAIPPFTLEQKHATAMGLAFFDTTRCIPWRGYERRGEPGFVADEHNCGVCEEVCPAPGKAIHFRRVEIEAQELRLPYVRAEACVGCGYCESVCPVQGKAAVRLSGGFRELPPARAVPAEPPPTEAALPARSGALRLAGPKTTYEGPDELFQYINGGADPYLTFGFLRVSAATYTDGEAQLKADLWQFQTPEDAFGAFAKDRRGKSADLGDEGAMQGASLWARRGRFTIALMPLAEVAPQDSQALARTALEALDEPPAPRPAICRRLPRGGLRAQTVLFMRDEMPLYDVYLADEFIPEGTWGFGRGAVGAYGQYDLEGAPAPAGAGWGARRKPPGLVLIRYRDGASAAATAERLAEVRAEWGDEMVQEAPVRVFRAGEADFCAVAARGAYMAAAFFIPSKEAAERLVQDGLG